MNSRSVVLSFVLVGLLSMPAFAATVTVAVAANVQYTFEELKAAFEQETGITLKPVFGASGKFTSQIENGAPFDVFMSADVDYPQILSKEGLTEGAPKVYGRGTLVIWTMTDADLSKGVEGLAAAGIRKIAIASPKNAPYGWQAVNAFKYYKIYPQVQKKLVYGESIAQTNQFITARAVEAGLTAKSIVLAPNLQGKGKWVEVDPQAYEPISQAAVILKHAHDDEAAQKFFDFLFSDEAKGIFKKYGYMV